MSRAFLVGETVRLQLRVSRPGSGVPANPAEVRLHSLRRDGAPVDVLARGFTRVLDGQYELALPTDGMQAGAYRWVALASDGPLATSLVEDTFVLRAP